MTARNETTVSVDGTDVDLEEQSMATRTIGFECSSGRWIEHEWTGVPIDRLLSLATVDPETTHVVITAADGHTACVDLPAALDGMLALKEDGERLEGPRFVSSGIGGPRAVSEVVALEPIELSPDEDPTDHESMNLVES